MQKNFVEESSYVQPSGSIHPETLANSSPVPTDSGTSFSRCLGFVSTVQRRLCEISSQLCSYGESIVKSNTIIIITNPLVEHRMPSFLKLVISIFLFLLRNFSKSKPNQRLAQQVQKSPQKITLRSSLWNIITLIIKRKLFSCEPVWYYEQLSSMMVFRQEIAYSIFTLIGHQQSYMSIQHFLGFCDQVNSMHSMVRVLPGYVYYLFGGSHLTISITTFTERLKSMTAFIATYVNGGNILLECVRTGAVKKSYQKDNQMMQRYLFLASDFKKTYSVENLNQLIVRIFGEDQTLTKNTFVQRVTESLNLNGLFQSNLLSKLVEFIRVEIALSESDCCKKSDSIAPKKQAAQSKYYLQSIDKLMNKCPFNGDERCDCKKCQCVRRNRQSAKNSQQKKREAMEQIGPLNEKVKALELRNTELERENMLLKSMLASLNQHPNFYGLVKESMEFLSKSINNH